MNEMIQNLLRLQTLECGETSDKNVASQVAELRAHLPQPVLVHYDRSAARGKKGVAIVRNQVCSGCHMHVPIGTINTLMQGHDIQRCGSCGRYLYLPDPAESELLAAVVAAKAAAKPRQRKALGQAV